MKVLCVCLEPEGGHGRRDRRREDGKTVSDRMGEDRIGEGEMSYAKEKGKRGEKVELRKKIRRKRKDLVREEMRDDAGRQD